MMDLADMIAYQADAVVADNSVNTTGLATASSGADGSSQGGATAARNTDAQSEAPSYTKDQAISLLKRALERHEYGTAHSTQDRTESRGERYR